MGKNPWHQKPGASVGAAAQRGAAPAGVAHKDADGSSADEAPLSSLKRAPTKGLLKVAPKVLAKAKNAAKGKPKAIAPKVLAKPRTQPKASLKQWHLKQLKKKLTPKQGETGASRSLGQNRASHQARH